MNFHARSILALFILTTGMGAGPGLGAEAESDRQKGGKRDAAATGIVVPDPLVNLLPFAVAKTYQDLFPDHRIWQCAQTGKGDSARYELTVFHPGDATVHGVDVGAAHVQTWFNYKLVLGSTGQVIREQAHPVPESTIPVAARKAFQKWSKPFPRGGPFDTEWSAGKEEGAERLYKVAVILNSVEWYRATLKADGTFLDKDSQFQSKRPAYPTNEHDLRGSHASPCAAAKPEQAAKGGVLAHGHESRWHSMRLSARPEGPAAALAWGVRTHHADEAGAAQPGLACSRNGLTVVVSFNAQAGVAYGLLVSSGFHTWVLQEAIPA